jgi:hypothetical protein
MNATKAQDAHRGAVKELSEMRTLTLPLKVTYIEGEGWVCEAGDEDHNAPATYVIDALQDSNADVRYVCDEHLKALDSTSQSTDKDSLAELKAAIEKLPTYSGNRDRGIWLSRKDVLSLIKATASQTEGETA